MEKQLIDPTRVIILHMLPQLLTTKFHIPSRRSGLVARPQLLKELQRGLEERCKLALISAPAGYGKTTLVAEWIAQTQTAAIHQKPKIAWLSLDEADNDPIRFARYFLAALQKADESLGAQAQGLLEMPGAPPLPGLFDILLNDLAKAEVPFVLILDDYHLINNPVIHAALEYFLDHQPTSILLVLTTRADPPLALARLRARRLMTELRARDLRFTPDESRDFFGLANLPLAENALRALDERTEGWAAGLQLAALALQHQADPEAFIETFRGSHRYVLDYLAGEVIQQQGEEIRAFLTQTSILDRFNADLCNALTARDDSQAIITRLEQFNLFIIPLDDERRWYRYHPLFSDYLCTLLSKEAQTGLHKKASAWHEANDMPVESVRHALASGDMEFAADTLDWYLQRDAPWSSFNLGMFTSWLDALPAQFFGNRPRLSLDAALIFYAAGRMEASEALVIQAERAIHSLSDMAESKSLLVFATLIRGLISAFRGEFQNAIDQITSARLSIPREGHLEHASALFGLGQAYSGLGHHERAIECYLLSSDEARLANAIFPMVNARCAAARIQVAQGRLSHAGQTCRQAIEYAGDKRFPPLGLAWTVLGNIALERNDLRNAEKLLQDGLALSRQAHLNDDVTWGLIYLARLRAAYGDSLGALAAIQEAQNIVKAYKVPRLSLLASSYAARIQYQIKQSQAAAQWAQEYLLIRSETPIEHADLTLARILLSTGKLESLPGILYPILDKATAAGQMQTALEAMILLGLYYRARGETAAALEWLAKSLELAAPEGYIRIFLDEGPPLLDLLPRVRQAAPGLVDAILNGKPAEAESRSAPLDGLPDPLSEQEIRVLKLIVAGKSNAEIAAELVISVGTAKWHVHNILQKLGAKNRPQAIARARELGI